MFVRRSDLNRDGFAVVATLLDAEELAHIDEALAAVNGTEAVRRRSSVYAIRNLLDVAPSIIQLVNSPKISALVIALLDEKAIAVRATLFDKTRDANWLVPWHQDLTICVKERLEVPGFGPWTVKAGVHHVQPPVQFLEGMLAIRIHLDPCEEHNGPLRVLPGTHLLGRLDREGIEKAQATGNPVTCSVPRGGAVIMKPLLLHASSAARQPSHRRVIHIDFTSLTLPSGLAWFTDRTSYAVG